MSETNPIPTQAEEDDWSIDEQAPDLSEFEDEQKPAVLPEPKTDDVVEDDQTPPVDDLDDSQTSSKKKLVPLAALRDERTKRQALEAKLTELTERYDRFINTVLTGQKKPEEKEAEIPDFVQDPIGHLKSALDQALKQIHELTETGQKTQKEIKQSKETDALTARWMTDVQKFQNETADFTDAINFLAKSRNDELKQYGYDDKEILKIIADEAKELAQRSYAEMDKTGKVYNPVAKLYKMAQMRGWKPSTATDPEPKKKDTSSVRGFKGSGSGQGSKAGKYSAEYIASLSEDQFAQLLEEVGGWKGLNG